MAAIIIRDIYGRNYLVNFDTVKFIEISDKESCGDLMITFIDQARQSITAGQERKDAIAMFKYISRLIGATDITGYDSAWG